VQAHVLGPARPAAAAGLVGGPRHAVEPTVTTTHLRRGSVRVALHAYRDQAGPPLLLLHGLGRQSPSHIPRVVARWPGPVFGLDFTGHGGSDVPVGGGYTPEALLVDVDVAVAHIGRAAVLGRGLGAYVALLFAGSRPTQAAGTILASGPGLGRASGRGLASTVGPQAWPPGAPAGAPIPPDPLALAELSTDLRPPGYARALAAAAMASTGDRGPLVVTAANKPRWLEAVAAVDGVRTMTMPEAVRYCSSRVG
jgi:pimeloyl-ACP methyl ester carboxylesterase